MATTAFNHAIDCYNSHEADRAKEWATKAISLSQYCDDDQRLECALQERYLRLNFDAFQKVSLVGQSDACTSKFA